MTTTTELAAVLAQLDDDGDTVELDDGRTLRLRIETDDESPFDHINGCDAYGRVAWVERYRGDHYRGQATRPDGFTGRAVKLHVMGGDAFWWEPYYEGGAYTPPTSAEQAWMAELVTFGFKGVTLELRESVTDSRGNDHDVTVATAALWGLDTLDETNGYGITVKRNGYLHDDILPDLAAELGLGR